MNERQTLTWMATLLTTLCLVGCVGSATPSPTIPSASVQPSVRPSADAPVTPGPTGAVVSSPSPRVAYALTALPVRRSAREIGLQIAMAAGPGGTLFILIPGSESPVLALLDGSGRSSPGWPIALGNSDACRLLLAVDDGSARVVCSEKDLPGEGVFPGEVRAHAFGTDGRSLDGWPVQLPHTTVARMVGPTMTLFTQFALSDVPEPDGRIVSDAWLTTVDEAGSTSKGAVVHLTEFCCSLSRGVGPEGSAFLTAVTDQSAERSALTRLDSTGIAPGWPVTFDGITSAPAFGPDGHAVMTVGSFVRPSSRIVAVDYDGEAISGSSPELPIGTAETGVDCVAGTPEPPIVSEEGRVFLVSEIDPRIFALDPNLQPAAGWPLTPATPLERPDPFRGFDGLQCSSPARPAVGSNGSLYLALQARSATVGGSIVAVGIDGRVQPGWPIELKRPGAEFWSVVAGPDGTVYALAIEPEPENLSSATILAIAPDGTILYRATIVDP